MKSIILIAITLVATITAGGKFGAFQRDDFNSNSYLFNKAYTLARGETLKSAQGFSTSEFSIVNVAGK
jgi:hypothetical protein